jgi:16S rRNA (uracil1498-N3)-methyltransferase
VLRMKKGDAVIVFDDTAGEYDCVIEQVDPVKIVLLIKKKIAAVKAVVPILSVACALPKKSKIDDIIDKLTQIGCNHIIPISTERSIVRLNQAKALAKHKRWQKISHEASLQSHRRDFAQVSPLKDFSEILSGSSAGQLKIILTLSCDKERLPLKEVLLSNKSGDILILIGPEGDFSPKEVGAALINGFIPVTLGPQVLRVDTAAIAAASFVRLLL